MEPDIGEEGENESKEDRVDKGYSHAQPSEYAGKRNRNIAEQELNIQFPISKDPREKEKK